MRKTLILCLAIIASLMLVRADNAQAQSLTERPRRHARSRRQNLSSTVPTIPLTDTQITEVTKIVSDVNEKHYLNGGPGGTARPGFSELNKITGLVTGSIHAYATTPTDPVQDRRQALNSINTVIATGGPGTGQLKKAANILAGDQQRTRRPAVPTQSLRQLRIQRQNLKPTPVTAPLTEAQKSLVSQIVGGVNEKYYLNGGPDGTIKAGFSELNRINGLVTGTIYLHQPITVDPVKTRQEALKYTNEFISYGGPGSKELRTVADVLAGKPTNVGKYLNTGNSRKDIFNRK